MRDRLGQCPGSKRGPFDGAKSDRPWQVGIEDPSGQGPEGLPLSLGISGTNRHDSQGLEPLVRGIPPIRSRRGLCRRRPDKLHADKGYDYAHLRRWLRKGGIRHHIARKAVEPSQPLGRHRWVVERTVSWLAGCRRLHRRYERKAEHFLAFRRHSLSPHLPPPPHQVKRRLKLGQVPKTPGARARQLRPPPAPCPVG